MGVNSQKTKFKRIVINGKGGAEVVEFIDVDMLEPNQNEVRIKVQAAGIAFADIMARKGMFPAILAYPYTPGYDIVGVVDKLGEGVSGFNVGQKVAALLTKFGGYQEYVNVPKEMLVNVPESVDSAEAVSLVLNYLTAYYLIYNAAKAKSAERVLITSAAGGVGTALIQLGKLAGLEMFGTASKAKLEFVNEQGAIAIDYQNEDFVKQINELTVNKGVDVVFDAIGGKTSSRAYGLLAKGGKLISYGFLSAKGNSMMSMLPAIIRIVWLGLLPDGKLAKMSKSLPIVVEKDNEWYRQTLTKLMGFLAEAKIKPVIAERLPLTEAAKAMELLETGARRGKIVLISQ